MFCVIFFLFLFENKSLQPITIMGYHSAIARVYRLCGLYDPGKNIVISALIDNFQMAKPRKTTLFLGWSLEIVLWYLGSNSFEPLISVRLNFVTYTTIFLVTLATAKRVSELHALSARDDCLRFNQDGSVTLQTLPGFVAKNKRPTDGSQRVTILPLNHLTTLCPVRALKIYLQCTRENRRSSDPFFISVRNP